METSFFLNLGIKKKRETSSQENINWGGILGSSVYISSILRPMIGFIELLTTFLLRKKVKRSMYI